METLVIFLVAYGLAFVIVIGLLRYFWDSLSKEIQAVGKVFLFLVSMVLIYMFVGWKITMMTGGEKGMVIAAKGVSVDNGEAIYWGRGRCTTCHSLGTRGSAVRCPNHGVQLGKDFVQDPARLTAMGERMFARAEERSKATGEKWHGVDYLWECLGDPGGYVVAGFKNEMPITFKPPINLNLEDIQSVMMYLWSQEGEPDINLIMNPTGPGKKFHDLIKKTTEEAATASPFKTYIDGDPEAGEKMFFDPKSPAPCFKCHMVKDKGGTVGPALTTVGGTRSVEFIIESILKPSAVIASGFEPIKLETVDGEIITGVNAGVTDKEATIKLSTGEERVIPLDQLKGGKYGTMPKVIIKTFGGKVKGWFLEEKGDAIELMNLEGTEKIIVQKTTIKSTIKLKKKNTDGKKKIEGYIKAQNEENVTIITNIQGKGFDAYKGGKEVVIPRKEIKKIRNGYRKPAVMSIMPGNFRDLLSVKNLHDIVAFLVSIA
ncbi:MAG: hypothetical protein V3U15_00910 [Nitrospinota bacterium]